MNVFQVIQHSYNSDDGHYEATPLGETVYQDEAAALALRDGLNTASIAENQAYVGAEITRRRAHWEANGRVEPPARNQHGTQYHDPYSTKGIAEYERQHRFTGDPTDIDAIERFAGFRSSLMFYTYETLRVI